MSFANDAQNFYQQPAAPQKMQQPNNFIPQQPLHGHMNATPPPMQQQQHQAFQPYSQQAQYPPMPINSQPIPDYTPMPPLAQGQGFAPPLGDGHASAGPVNAGAVNTGDGAPGKERKSSLVKAKMQFKSRDIWVGGESHIGRRGKDGEWNEVRGCSVM